MSEVQNSGKFCLVLLEGIGCSDSDDRNAVKKANMEYLNSLKESENCIYQELEANGLKVGLPASKPGNSGVGILVIGAGKRQYRNLVRINNMIEDGSFEKNEVLQKVLQDTVEGNGRIHFIGNFTNSEEEADMKQLRKLIQCAKAAGVKEVYIHGFLDSDIDPTGPGLELVKDLESWLSEEEYGVIGSLAGKNGIIGDKSQLDTLEKYFKIIAYGDNVVDVTPSDYVQLRYDQLEEDNTISPALLSPKAQLQDGDHVFLFNVRTANSSVLLHMLAMCDTSAPQSEGSQAITKQLTFMGAAVKPDIRVASLVQYDDTEDTPIMIRPVPVQKTYVRSIGDAGKKQLRVAEESRYTHIKFLLNGAGDMDVPGDDTVMIHENSKEKNIHSLVTMMESTSNMVCNAMKAKYYDAISTILSGVGIACSTHSEELTVKMCQEVDRILKHICEVGHENGYTMVVVGTNAEATRVPVTDDDVDPMNNVPCAVIPAEGQAFEKTQLEWYSLENVAATCLKIVGINPEDHMEPSLICCDCYKHFFIIPGLSVITLLYRLLPLYPLDCACTESHARTPLGARSGRLEWSALPF